MGAENIKKLFLFTILSIGIISGVVLSPEIWAIVEPHITITMDPGQTTKPFVINDDSGSEVFSVDVDGTINPTSAGTDGLTSLEFYRGPALQFNNIQTDPLVLAKWRLQWNLDTDPGSIPIAGNGGMLSGELRTVDQIGGASAGVRLEAVRIDVTNGGSGYTSAPTLTIQRIGSTVIATANISGGSVTSVDIISSSTFFNGVPSVKFSGGGGSGAAATAVMGIGQFAFLNGGQNFITPPDVIISGGGGSGASGTAVLTDGVVTSIILNSKGSGYTSSPQITIGPPVQNVFVEFVTLDSAGNEVNGFYAGLAGFAENFEKDSDTIFQSGNFFRNVNPVDIELRVWSEDATVTGEVRNLYAVYMFKLPDFITVERLI